MCVVVKKLDNKISNENGLALIELVAAMLILAVLYLSYASYSTTSFTNSLISEQDTLALNYAREKLEEVKSLENNPGPTQNGIINDNYYYTLQISSFENDSKLFKVTVTINYTPKPDLQKKLQLSTLTYFQGDK